MRKSKPRPAAESQPETRPEAGAPGEIAEAQRLLTELGAALEAFAVAYPEAKLSDYAPALLDALRSHPAAVAEAGRAVEKRREQEARESRQREEDRRLTEHIDALHKDGLIWTGGEAAEALDISSLLLPAARTGGMLVALAPPAGLEEAWRRAYPPLLLYRREESVPFYEARSSPLTAEERAALDEAAKGVHLSAQDSADELGISIGTFRKYAREVDLEVADHYVSRSGWAGDLFRLFDITSLIAPRLNRKALAAAEKRREAELARLAKAWAGLNERQRIYLRVAYHRFSSREYFRRQGERLSDTPWDEEAGGWMWLYHDEVAGLFSLAETLREHKLLDPGAGSTWAALEDRGLIERRGSSVEVYSMAYGTRGEPVLWVRLTLEGRRLARASYEYPEEFPVEEITAQ